MTISTDDIKQLRDETGISVMQCKQALEEAEGDMDKARIMLRKKGSSAASKKADRELGSGVVQAYIHAGGSVGAMVELLCETDFVAKNEEFQKLAYEFAMQVAATGPDYLSAEDIDKEAHKKAEEVFAKEAADKPKDMQEKILKGKLDAYFKDKVLLNQDYIKDSSQTIQQMLDTAVQTFGEKTEIGRFERFSVLG